MMKPRHGAQIVLIFVTTEKITDALFQLVRDFLEAILDVISGCRLSRRFSDLFLLAVSSWSFQHAVGMIWRGEVGLIVASVALRAELLTPEVFSGVVFMGLGYWYATPAAQRPHAHGTTAAPVAANEQTA